MLERISIQNFKSIGDLTLDLSPVTVIVGRSGTGKSNLLGAIRFLRDYLIDAKGAAGIAGGWPAIIPATHHDATLRIEVQFRLTGFQNPFKYGIGFSINQHDRPNQFPSDERFMMGNRVIFAWKQNKWEVEPDVSNPPSLRGNLVLGQLPTISEAVLAFTALSTGIGWHGFPATVLTTDNQRPRTNDTSDGLDDAVSADHARPARPDGADDSCLPTAATEFGRRIFGVGFDSTTETNDRGASLGREDISVGAGAGVGWVSPLSSSPACVVSDAAAFVPAV